jgi:hypothetical protein
MLITAQAGDRFVVPRVVPLGMTSTVREAIAQAVERRLNVERVA